MLQSESADMPINVGDKLIGIDSEILILAHDPEADTFTCDIFNISGNLIGPHRIIDGNLIRTCVRKKQDLPERDKTLCQTVLT
jgi:hypothetical protein